MIYNVPPNVSNSEEESEPSAGLNISPENIIATFVRLGQKGRAL